jgi:hypothetical protein
VALPTVGVRLRFSANLRGQPIGLAASWLDSVFRDFAQNDTLDSARNDADIPTCGESTTIGVGVTAQKVGISIELAQNVVSYFRDCGERELVLVNQVNEKR